jgi:osmoprotectant transport system ATP-binding protein
MSTPAAVELRKASKVFPGGVKALDDVSLTVPAGRIVALLGPSGCGKTTTLRLINRLEEPTGGQVLVRGQDVTSQRPEVLRRSIGYVIQEGGLFPHLDVAANVATVPKLLGWPRPKVRGRVAEVLALVGLSESDYGRRMPAELSGGQRQRIGVARALAADPDLLLMDEPFGALDPGTREAIQDEFLLLQQRLHKTVLLVTHDIGEAGKLADDIVLMDRGQVIQEGSLRDLLLRPANARVRAFLGKQGHGLALEALRLNHLIDNLPTVTATEKPIRLSGHARLGEVLVALARADEGGSVVLDDDPARAYPAKTLRDRILSDLGAAAGGGERGETNAC